MNQMLKLFGGVALIAVAISSLITLVFFVVLGLPAIVSLAVSMSLTAVFSYMWADYVLPEVEDD